MNSQTLSKIIADKLLLNTIFAAIFSDGLLLLPFFFTTNLFSKILPSGNVSSLVLLLVFSVVALALSSTYDRLRTAGLLYLRRRLLVYLKPQEGVLLFTKPRDLSPSLRLLQTMYISLVTGEFINIASSVLQIFFPLAVLILTLFISFKLFLLLVVVLTVYSVVFQIKTLPKQKSVMNEKLESLKRRWFYRWSDQLRIQAKYFDITKKSAAPWAGAGQAASLSGFRYASSLVLLAASAFLIILDGLPTGLLLPISFFSSRLLLPAERVKYTGFVYKTLLLAVNARSSSIAAPDAVAEQSPQTAELLESINFSGGMSLRVGEETLTLENGLKLMRGQLAVVSGASGAGKTTLMESVLGFHPLLSGNVEVKCKNVFPWSLFYFLGQGFSNDSPKHSFYGERLEQLARITKKAVGSVILIDDPFMGMDAITKAKALDLLMVAKSEGATLLIVSNDKQLVDRADIWMVLSDNMIKLNKVS